MDRLLKLVILCEGVRYKKKNHSHFIPDVILDVFLCSLFLLINVLINSLEKFRTLGVPTYVFDFYEGGKLTKSLCNT